MIFFDDRNILSFPKPDNVIAVDECQVRYQYQQVKKVGIYNKS